MPSEGYLNQSEFLHANWINIENIVDFGSWMSICGLIRTLRLTQYLGAFKIYISKHLQTKSVRSSIHRKGLGPTPIHCTYPLTWSKHMAFHVMRLSFLPARRWRPLSTGGVEDGLQTTNVCEAALSWTCLGFFCTFDVGNGRFFLEII